MADISKVILPDNSEYDIKDATARSGLSDKQDTLVSGTNIKTINNTTILGSGNIDTTELPSQTSNSGKFLTTDGTDPSWGTVPATVAVEWFTYGTSTSAQIEAAYQAGKQCLVYYSNRVYNLIYRSSATSHTFGYVWGSTTYRVACSSDSWTNTSVSNQAQITASGILKGAGSGTVSAATAGTDYLAPPSSPSSGNVLTYNGSAWVASAVPTELPSQTSQSGKFLTTDGSAVSWADTPTEIPSQTSHSGEFLTTNGTALSWGTPSGGGSLPDQTGHSGDILTTNGTTASWMDTAAASTVSIDSAPTLNSTNLVTSGGVYTAISGIDALPSQTGQSGKFLTTNGSAASWDNAPTELPTQTGNSGKFLTTNGSAVSWADTPTELPTQTGNSGKYLTTNGSSVSWAAISSGGMYYAVCDTSAATAQKEIAVSGITELTAGLSIRVQFANANTISNPTLKVNSLDAKAIYCFFSTAETGAPAEAYQWRRNEVLDLCYNGTYWYIVNEGLATDAYYGVTKLSSSTSSTSTSLAATASAVKSAYDRSATLINRTTNVNAANTSYTTLMARGEKLLDSTTFDGVSDWSTHLVNGAVAWSYE